MVENNNLYFTYVIQEKSKNKIYIGFTSDLQKRINRHNGFLANEQKSYTSKNSGAWHYLHVEGFSSEKEARFREKQLKTAVGRKFLKNL